MVLFEQNAKEIEGLLADSVKEHVKVENPIKFEK
jgi:hypothetical protein